MTINLDKMSKEELVDLKKQVEKALESVELRRKAEAIKAAEEAVRQFGFSLQDLTSGKTKSPSLPKYRNPEDPSQTWTGRGRKPQWLITAITAGRSIEELEI